MERTADQQSALNVISVLAVDKRSRFNLYSTESDQRFHVRGGNDQIATLLARSLGDNMRTAAPLVAITSLPDGKVRLSFKRDSGVGDAVYDRVILALPFSVMRVARGLQAGRVPPAEEPGDRQRCRWAPRPSSSSSSTRRAWTDAGCNGEMRVPSQTFQTTWEVSRAQPGTRGILNFFSGGTRAINAGKTDSVALASMVMGDAAPITPGLSEIWTGLMIEDAWKNNPVVARELQLLLAGLPDERFSASNASAKGTASSPASIRPTRAASLNSGVQTGMRAASEVIASLR